MQVKHNKKRKLPYRLNTYFRHWSRKSRDHTEIYQMQYVHIKDGKQAYWTCITFR